MKKSILLVAFITVVLAGMLMAADSKKHFGIIYATGEAGDGRYATVDEATKALMSQTGLQKINGAMTIVDTVFKNWSDDLTPYFGGEPGDTMTVYFNPGPVIIKKIVCNIGYNAGNPGLNLVDGVNVSLNYANYDGVCDTMIGDGNKTPMGTMALDGTWTPESWYAAHYSKPPVGEAFWGPYPLKIIADPEDALEEVETKWFGFEPDNQGKPFVVAFVPYGAAGTNNGFADRQDGVILPAAERMWKWYTTDHQWYNWRAIGFRMYLIVEYYANMPPTVSDVNQIVSTYDLSKNFVVQAILTDVDASDETKAGIAEAYVVWSTEAGKVDSAAMTNVSGDQWEGKINGLTQQDVKVKYWISVKDKGDQALYGKSRVYSFTVGPTNPNADLLLLFEYPLNARFYQDALDNLGFVYEEWDVVANGGVDASVTSFGWSTIAMAAYGDSTVPTRGYEGNQYATFLNNGGNLALFSLDYFYMNKEGDEGTDTTFSSGDFAYDFFGLAGGVNDPGANIDSVIYGVANDPISGSWAKTPLNTPWWRYAGLTDYNWIDYVKAGNGTVIFNAESHNSVGVRYEGSNFKTVYLSFMPDAMGTDVASPNLKILMQNILTWFGTSNTVSVEKGSNTSILNSYSLEQNYPNPFNPVTTIEYSIPKDNFVTVAIYNVLGEKITELVKENQKAGIYKVTWDAKNAANGVYFYKLEAGDYSKTMKMLLLR
jgi:hypothetical protein